MIWWAVLVGSFVVRVYFSVMYLGLVMVGLGLGILIYGQV